MWQLAAGTFSGWARTTAPSPSLWSNKSGRQLMGDLCAETGETRGNQKSEVAMAV